MSNCVRDNALFCFPTRRAPKMKVRSPTDAHARSVRSKLPNSCPLSRQHARCRLTYAWALVLFFVALHRCTGHSRHQKRQRSRRVQSTVVSSPTCSTSRSNGFVRKFLRYTWYPLHPYRPPVRPMLRRLLSGVRRKPHRHCRGAHPGRCGGRGRGGWGCGRGAGSGRKDER